MNASIRSGETAAFDGRGYAAVTAAYWAFTLTDGALRMLVLLHFRELGYTPVQLAFLFLLYEFCGILTNLFGGWIGARFGLRITLFAGLAIQVGALMMLSFIQPGWLPALSVAYVMSAQALSGIAKDLTKMSSKSAVKLLVPSGGDAQHAHSALFRWVAVLTGSKNALKGIGFFVGGALLTSAGFQSALWLMAGVLAIVLLALALRLRGDIGRSKSRPAFRQLLSKSGGINRLSLARFFLFGSRDVWFVVALPLFLAESLGWGYSAIGGFMAAWVIGYGFVQAAAPRIVRGRGLESAVKAAWFWGFALVAVCWGIAALLDQDWNPEAAVLGGLAVFGIVFAVNSSVHSYLILAYADQDAVAMDVGFYYMANACGRLAGTLLSGVVFLKAGLEGCLWTSGAMALAAAIIGLALPRHDAG